MSGDVRYTYKLDKCLEWIVEHSYKRIVLQFKPTDLEHSIQIVSYLENANKERIQQCTTDQDCSLDFYVSQSISCCVDLIVTQHVSNVDAIIHFGKACLSKPFLANQERDLPILFALTNSRHDSSKFTRILEKITDHIQTVSSVNSNCPVCILYETEFAEYAEAIDSFLECKKLKTKVDVAKLIVPSSTWSTTANQSYTVQHSNSPFGQYNLPRSPNSYKSAIYLSEKPSINLILQLPSNTWRIDCNDALIEKVDVSRTLNKRMALVGRLKDDEELKFGVIITNPLPDISQVLARLERYANVRKHTLYLISMVQTIDECKIGNFDLCDAFVVVNACSCSTILESLYFNRPIINELEFRLVCGFETVYGQVIWPSSNSHLSAEDLENKRKVSDVSLALVHSRNELLERCSSARTNLWSGLDYKKTDSCQDSNIDELAITEGLHGIASSYKSEPLKKRPDAGDK